MSRTGSLTSTAAPVSRGPDLLEAIVASTRRIVRERSRKVSIGELARQAYPREPRGDLFEANLARPDAVNVIAECKRRSPSRGVLRRRYEPVEIAHAYEAGGAAAISVLTEPTFFDGSLEDLEAIGRTVALPLLRKDFIIDEYQLLEARLAGADAVLLIVAALEVDALGSLLAAAHDLGLACLVEVHDEDEADRAVDAGARVIGVNNRNLRTLETDIEVSARVVSAIPDSVIAVAESGLRSGADIQRCRRAGYRAFLIGERLMATERPADALRALMADVGIARDR